MDLKKEFGHIRFVIFGGSNDRMKIVANSLAKSFWPVPLGQELVPIGSTTRYVLYRVGCVICVSHQMGMASVSILLNEITKLLAYAEAKDVVYLRLGTSGGIGLEPGTVVITQEAVNGYLEPYYELVSMGRLIKMKSAMSDDVIAKLMDAAKQLQLKYPVVTGKTMSVDTFYEGQARLDGAICEYTEQDKSNFITKLHQHNVANIEMEALLFGAFCNKLNIKVGVICVALLDRIKGDQVTFTAEDYLAWVDNTLNICKAFIAKELGIPFSA
uniref:Uridine phosphorylase 1 n=1 Tax=Lygus hesperus TaxID=30085 RepID=A0A0A9YS89_LYGHE